MPRDERVKAYLWDIHKRQRDRLGATEGLSELIETLDGLLAEDQE